MSWNWTSIFIAIGVWLLGYAIGLVEMYLRQSRKVKQLEEELQRKEIERFEPAPPPRASDALRVWFDEKQGFHLELDGSVLDTPDQITPVQRKRLIELLSRLRPWLEGQGIRQTVAPSPPAEAVRSAPPSVAAHPEQSVVGTPALSLDAGETSTPAVSIIEQINGILQRRLSGTPLAGKVRLREQIGGGIEIWVNTKRYTSVDEVAEADVKAAIRAAIAEWEHRS